MKCSFYRLIKNTCSSSLQGGNSFLRCAGHRKCLPCRLYGAPLRLEHSPRLCLLTLTEEEGKNSQQLRSQFLAGEFLEDFQVRSCFWQSCRWEISAVYCGRLCSALTLFSSLPDQPLLLFRLISTPASVTIVTASCKRATSFPVSGCTMRQKSFSHSFNSARNYSLYL